MKLTITDAEEAATVADAAPEPQAKPVVPMDAERLRDIARRLATADPAPPPPVTPVTPSHDDELDDLPGPGNVTSGYTLPSARQSAEEQAANEVTGTGPRRERLRLKPVQRTAPSSDH